METVDARGLSCPEPVIMTRNTLKKTTAKEVTVLVSSSVARDNVTRSAKGMGWNIRSEEKGSDYKLHLSK